MPDELDYIQERVDKETQLLIDDARARTYTLPAIGTCYNCGEPLEPSMRYCDEYCRDDHEYRLARRKV